MAMVVSTGGSFVMGTWTVLMVLMRTTLCVDLHLILNYVIMTASFVLLQIVV
jgi:hypothetical protein